MRFEGGIFGFLLSDIGEGGGEVACVANVVQLLSYLLFDPVFPWLALGGSSHDLFESQVRLLDCLTLVFLPKKWIVTDKKKISSWDPQDMVAAPGL